MQSQVACNRIMNYFHPFYFFLTLSLSVAICSFCYLLDIKFNFIRYAGGKICSDLIRDFFRGVPNENTIKWFPSQFLLL